jgi:hypothetical protein
MIKLFTLTVALILLVGCSDSKEEDTFTDKPDMKFEIHVQGLESDDMTTRQNAFDYLATQGEKGINAIKDFCKRHTDNEWGKEEDGFRCRISTDPILYYEAGGYEPMHKGNVVEGCVTIELKNVSPNSLNILTYDGGIVTNPLHSTTIETYVGKKPKEYKVIREIVGPEKVVQVGKGETISGKDSTCNIRYFDWADNIVVCFRNYQNMDKGIYFITYRICVFREDTGVSYIQSNRICFALLPAQKK